jgi:acylphosphatase
MIRRQVRISGRVQGVFFRDSCQTKASRAGVVGWVRNAPDGTVEAVFEGGPDAVQTMCDWCRNGPEQADVDHIEVTEEEPQGDTSFDVR